jgi:hypothetical protein
MDERSPNLKGRRSDIHPPMGLVSVQSQTDPDLQEKLSQHQLTYSLLGLGVGLVCIIGGCILFLHGVTGATSWTASFLGAESKISDAAPGAILFVVGLFIVFLTRYGYRHNK